MWNIQDEKDNSQFINIKYAGFYFILLSQKWEMHFRAGTFKEKFICVG